MDNLRDAFAASPKEGKLLFKLASDCKGIGVIVEIGSWKGYSTICLAKGAKSTKVYAIDTFAGDVNNFVSGEGSTYDEFVRNIENAGVSDSVIPVVKTSEQASQNWDYPIELLWIDGDHEDVFADFDRWYPHLIYGGVIALHDTVYSPNMIPYKVAVKELYKSGRFANVGRVGCLTYARKVHNISMLDRLRNRFALYRRYIYQFFIPYYTKCLVIADSIFKGMK